MKNRLPSFFAVVTLALAFSAARADTDVTIIKFSDPTKPGKLKVSLGHGELRVRGADTTEITVKSDAKAVTSAPRKDGLRVLTASTSFALSEKDNVVVLDSGFGGWKGGGSDFDVTVPRGTSIAVPNATGGDIFVADITGDVELKSINGEIKLENLSGGVQVETMNGEIRASFTQLPENKPLSFVSMNGEINVRVPNDTKANVRLRTQNGTILTDFDDKALLTKTESLPNTKGSKSHRQDSSEIRAAAREAAQMARDAAEVADRAVRAAVAEVRAGPASNANGDPISMPMMAPMPPMPALPPMTGGKLVSGTLNGGGPEILLTAMNGDVVLRKIQAKK